MVMGIRVEEKWTWEMTFIFVPCTVCWALWKVFTYLILIRNLCVKYLNYPYFTLRHREIKHFAPGTQLVELGWETQSALLSEPAFRYNAGRCTEHVSMCVWARMCVYHQSFKMLGEVWFLFSCMPSLSAFRLFLWLFFYIGEEGHVANYKVVQIAPLLESFW